MTARLYNKTIYSLLPAERSHMADSMEIEDMQTEPAQTVAEINLKHYIAFLSHRSTDHDFAEMLLKKLEHYRIGNKLRSDYGIERKHIKPVCIDSNEFASKDLQKEMRTKLDNSAWMVLLCSRASAAHYSEQLNWDADPSVIADWTLGAGNGFPKASQDELVEFYGGYKKA